MYKQFLDFLYKENLREWIKIKKIYIFTLLIISLTYISIYTKENIYKARLKERMYDFGGDFRVLESFGIFAWQIKGIFEDSKFLDRLEKSKNVLEDLGKGRHYNLIFLQIESLDSFILNKEIKGIKVMPFLSNLSLKSIYYPYTISYHYGGGTSDCEFSIFNSIEPLLNYPAIKILDYPYRNSFVHLLRKNRYKCLAFHGNRGDFWNRDYALKAMGFEEFFDINKMKLKMEGWGAKDGDVFEFAYKKLKIEKVPFFYFIITMSSHIPFANVLKYYKNEKFDFIEDRTLKNYILSMSYVDFVLEKYIPKFMEIPNTYIFVYGDHVGFIEENLYKGSYILLDGLKVEFVPLIIISPEGVSYKEENFVASFLDLAPTALYSSGIPFKYNTEGQNLLNFPIKNGYISLFKKEYNRDFLFNLIKEEGKN